MLQISLYIVHHLLFHSAGERQASWLEPMPAIRCMCLVSRKHNPQKHQWDHTVAAVCPVGQEAVHWSCPWECWTQWLIAQQHHVDPLHHQDTAAQTLCHSDGTNYLHLCRIPLDVCCRKAGIDALQCAAMPAKQSSLREPW